MGLRVAVVGAGLMGGWHARYAARFAEVAAIVDRRREAAALLCRRFPGAAVFEELSECLKSCSVDVVHVCTDLASHGTLIETALLQGKHVLCEKPAARSARELDPLVALVSGASLSERCISSPGSAVFNGCAPVCRVSATWCGSSTSSARPGRKD